MFPKSTGLCVIARIPILMLSRVWYTGSLLPFTSREDMDFFSHLEMHLRQEHAPLSGRDHMSYRSSYFPVKDVIDGDLCEQYTQVSPCITKRGNSSCNRRHDTTHYT